MSGDGGIVSVNDVEYTVVLLDVVTWHVDERTYPDAHRAVRAANRAISNGQEVVHCGPTSDPPSDPAAEAEKGSTARG